MPYKSNTDLPDSVRDHLPGHAQDIFREAFNNAYDEYHQDESRSFAVAWNAVEKKYKKNEQTGDWEPK